MRVTPEQRASHVNYLTDITNRATEKPPYPGMGNIAARMTILGVAYRQRGYEPTPSEVRLHVTQEIHRELGLPPPDEMQVGPHPTGI